MMNIRNLASKESLDPWYASSCVESLFKATDIFVILLSQEGFESDCPQIKFQTITS